MFSNSNSNLHESRGQIICPFKLYQNPDKPLCLRISREVGQCGICVGEKYSGWGDLINIYLRDELGVTYDAGDSIHFNRIDLDTATITIKNGGSKVKYEYALQRGYFIKIT